MTDPRSLLKQVAERCFIGLDAGQVASELQLGFEEARTAVERVEAVLLLLSQSIPEALLARGARLEPWETETILTAIRERLGDPSRLAGVVEARKLNDPKPSQSTSGLRSAHPGHEIPVNSSSEEALDVLEFWASKWE